MADIFMDYKFIGTVKDAKDFVERFVSERRMNRIDSAANIFIDKNTGSVFIETALGRTTRPLIVVKEGKSLLSKKHYEQLKKQGLNKINFNIHDYLEALRILKNKK